MISSVKTDGICDILWITTLCLLLTHTHKASDSGSKQGEFFKSRNLKITINENTLFSFVKLTAFVAEYLLQSRKNSTFFIYFDQAYGKKLTMELNRAIFGGYYLLIYKSTFIYSS